MATATAVRPVRATTAADLAAVFKLPESPADPAVLAGRIEQADKRTGEIREGYSTEHEPGGVLLKACRNRRASVCPACAETYRRDAWHLIAAGLRGDKGIPETVSEHPRLFLTFTAASLGPVHTCPAASSRWLTWHVIATQRTGQAGDPYYTEAGIGPGRGR